MENPKERIELLKGGVQIQSKKSRGIGTLACVVFDKHTGIPLGLSNKHILKKKRGFTVVQPAGRPRTSEFVIGSIFKKGGRGKTNDYAVFKIDLEKRQIDTNNSILGLEGKINSSVEPKIDMKVKKYGQTTGLTYGIIEEVDGNRVTIKPDPDHSVPEISKGGDSGALWVTNEVKFKAVALHRAGESSKRSSTPDKAFAIPINKVLKSLQVKF